VTRSVRDTAHLMAHTERPSRLPPIGLVEGPGARRLRVGLVADSVRGTTDDETRSAVLDAAALLTELGHVVEEMPLPVGESFAEDLSLYWGFCGWFAARAAPRAFPGWDAAKADGVTLGLSEYFARRGKDFPAALRRLRASKRRYAEAFRTRDLVLSPTLSHVTPRIGHLSPTVPFDTLFDRLRDYAGFTPLNNAAGGPAVSLPLGQTGTGLPIGIHLSAAHGDERTLLEIAYELEEARPFRRLGA
jgi:amidase